MNHGWLIRLHYLKAPIFSTMHLLYFDRWEINKRIFCYLRSKYWLLDIVKLFRLRVIEWVMHRRFVLGEDFAKSTFERLRWELSAILWDVFSRDFYAISSFTFRQFILVLQGWIFVCDHNESKTLPCFYITSRNFLHCYPVLFTIILKHVVVKIHTDVNRLREWNKKLKTNTQQI